MPKLNTTIDNLEWKSNKVTGAVPSADWTDTQYPSAKALYNAYNTLVSNIYPVGCIMTMATNKNPGETLGGTWVLVDKAFKNTYTNLTSAHWTSKNATISNYSSIMLNDHVVSLRLGLDTTKAITATDVNNTYLTLGTLNVAALGISNFSQTVYSGVAVSDNGQCTICYKVSGNGQIDLYDVLNADGTHTMPTASSFFIYLTQPINYDMMQDAYCDKFYWKRTA